MPVTVIVRSASGDESPSLTFDGARVVIGRSDGSDVRLPDPSVSSRHASIRAEGASFALVDEGSTNGTWVGEDRLSPHTPRLIKSGDLVRVGRVWLELVIGQRPPTPDLGLATRDLAYSLVQRAMEAVGDDTAATIRVAEGPDMGRELRLAEEGRVYLLGRAEGCDLPFADEHASPEHASVVRRGPQVFLRDIGARDGVYLGDARLEPHHDVLWRPPTVARAGASFLVLDDPVASALAEIEAAPDEALAESEAPPAPLPSPEPPAASPPSLAEPAPRDAGAELAAEARLVPVAPAPSRDPRRVWTSGDALVVAVAIAVIGASVAGLVWVLR